MILEDDRDIRASLKCGLEIDGFEVTALADGQSAVNELKHSASPDLIVLDLMMPIMSGEEFLSYRAADPKLSQIPVVVISANRDFAAAVAPYPATVALGKPFALTDLTTLIRKVFHDSPRAEKSNSVAS